MNFKEAVVSGKKVRSQYWDNSQSLDTTIFSDKMEDFMIDLFNSTATQLTWKEILGNWEFSNK